MNAVPYETSTPRIPLSPCGSSAIRKYLPFGRFAEYFAAVGAEAHDLVSTYHNPNT
ncbi:hypothetical protein [Bradyrhizobium macuxiense]|uniref:hypothetical protein n=1 Tax=Bradyrhizobium macuxiense TaxID=1755647 RepID=UPI000A5D409D|nr:hypothetical protein [Bradyrhizobium macuxiense]